MDPDLQDDASSSQPDIPWSRTQIGPTAAPDADAEVSDDDDADPEDDNEIAPASSDSDEE